MKLITLIASGLVAASLSGCAYEDSKPSAPANIMSSNQSNEAVLRRTVVYSLLSASAKGCDLKGVEQYRDSYVAAVRTQRDVSPEFEAKIRSWFTSADRVVRENYSAPEEKARLCERAAPSQAEIDRGIHGDFS